MGINELKQIQIGWFNYISDQRKSSKNETP